MRITWNTDVNAPHPRALRGSRAWRVAGRHRHRRTIMKAITTKYLGATNTRGARIVASDQDNNRVVIPYPHELNTEQAHEAAAKALCLKMQWTGRLIAGSLNRGYVFVFAK